MQYMLLQCNKNGGICIIPWEVPTLKPFHRKANNSSLCTTASILLRLNCPLNPAQIFRDVTSFHSITFLAFELSLLLAHVASFSNYPLSCSIYLGATSDLLSLYAWYESHYRPSLLIPDWFDFAKAIGVTHTSFLEKNTFFQTNLLFLFLPLLTAHVCPLFCSTNCKFCLFCESWFQDVKIR